jgi:hypothetical protein
MCSIDYGERYAVYHQTCIRARKQHKCNECGRMIASGEPYRRTSGLLDGSWTTNKVCQHCTIAANWLMDNCSGYLDRVVYEDINQHASEYRRADLWRLAVGMGRGWRRLRSDGLMQVPPQPKPIQLGDAR